MIEAEKRTAVERLRSYLFRRKRAYQVVFAGPVGEQVLADLAKFCRAHSSTFHADARVSAVLEGRREVFLRIANHLKLTQEELYNLYNGRKDV